MRRRTRTKGSDVRDGFYAIEHYDGLIKHYTKPFSADQHDALGPDDYLFTHFFDGQIVPLQP